MVGQTSQSQPPPSPPVSILFVCLGNICRSTMAEGAFLNHLKKAGAETNSLISKVDSAGTGAYHAGAPPDSRTTTVLRSRGIGDYKHSARLVKESDFSEFDLLVGMDRDNVADLEELRARLVKSGRLSAEDAQKKGRVMLYGCPEFGGRGKRGEEIDDPYYGGNEGFEVAYEQVTRLGVGMLAWLQGEK